MGVQRSNGNRDSGQVDLIGGETVQGKKGRHEEKDCEKGRNIWILRKRDNRKYQM